MSLGAYITSTLLKTFLCVCFTSSLGHVSFKIMSVFNSGRIRFLSLRYSLLEIKAERLYNVLIPGQETVAERCKEVLFPLVFSVQWKTLPDARGTTRTERFLCLLGTNRVQPRAPLISMLISRNGRVEA